MVEENCLTTKDSLITVDVMCSVPWQISMTQLMTRQKWHETMTWTSRNLAVTSWADSFKPLKWMASRQGSRSTRKYHEKTLWIQVQWVPFGFGLVFEQVSVCLVWVFQFFFHFHAFPTSKSPRAEMQGALLQAVWHSGLSGAKAWTVIVRHCWSFQLCPIWSSFNTCVAKILVFTCNHWQLFAWPNGVLRVDWFLCFFCGQYILKRDHNNRPGICKLATIPRTALPCQNKRLRERERCQDSRVKRTCSGDACWLVANCFLSILQSSNIKQFLEGGFTFHQSIAFLINSLNYVKFVRILQMLPCPCGSTRPTSTTVWLRWLRDVDEHWFWSCFSPIERGRRIYNGFTAHSLRTNHYTNHYCPLWGKIVCSKLNWHRDDHCGAEVLGWTCTNLPSQALSTAECCNLWKVLPMLVYPHCLGIFMTLWWPSSNHTLSCQSFPFGFALFHLMSQTFFLFDPRCISFEQTCPQENRLGTWGMTKVTNLQPAGLNLRPPNFAGAVSKLPQRLLEGRNAEKRVDRKNETNQTEINHSKCVFDACFLF